jgi:hypothetical protein
VDARIDYRRNADDGARLGKHKTGKGCVYINALADVDITVLAKLVASAAPKKGGEE